MSLMDSQVTTPSVDAPPGGSLRDTNFFYAEGDPLQWVDRSLLAEIKARSNGTLLDLGCGVGGYSRVLADAGYQVRALDVNPEYVRVARSIGVDAEVYDGIRIPLADASVDTVFMIEVLEHIRDPATFLAEAFRVARRNIVLTVPNNTQRFDGPVTWTHMLDVDHKNFFTVESLNELLSNYSRQVVVDEIAPADRALAKDVLSPPLFFVYRAFRKLGLAPDRRFFRLIANATK